MVDQPRGASLEEYFDRFRKHVIGYNQPFESPYGVKNIIYADWTASGRLYAPIENKLVNDFGPFVGNTHTETTVTGTSMTRAYHFAHKIIKEHVNADPGDVILTTGAGMTGAVSKLQRILGIKLPEQMADYLQIPKNKRPVVFVTHMEHHSNHTSWIETIADVECILPSANGFIDVKHLETLLHKYRDREMKIASVTACSNVTGIQTCYAEIAQIMHEHNGLCFVDFACSAPYVDIDMHPVNSREKLDAIYFSPHKFLGGPGSSGVLIFDSKLYRNKVPDQPGGGTVTWTNPWGERHYFDEIEVREDGGTPAFLQSIKAALCVRLKDKMGVGNLLQRERELLNIIFPALKKIEGLHILAEDSAKRLGVISLYIDGLHYNLAVKLLNDKFGIQVRGGCSCAGTYGHFLLNISKQLSQAITGKIDEGDLSAKPGWIRLSIHPVMTDKEAFQIVDAIEELVENHQSWQKDYRYDPHSNEFYHIHANKKIEEKMVSDWFGI